MEDDKCMCSFDKCLKCHLLNCRTGQVAREQGIYAYYEYLKMLDDAEKNCDIN